MKLIPNAQASRPESQQARLLTLTCWLSGLLACFLSIRAHAATEITAYVTITNIPAGLTSNITVNIGAADTRYWTNNAAAAPSINIQTTNSTAASVTNLIGHFGTYPVFSAGAGTPQALFQLSSTNTSAFTITAPLNTNLTVTFGGNWASVYYATSTLADFYPILSPTNGMSPRVRTNAENAVVNLLSVGGSSNAIPVNTKALSNYLDRSTAQTFSNKTFTHSVLQGPGRIVNATNITGTNVALTNVTLYLVAISGASSISGFLGSLTNGAAWSNLLYYSTLTNPISYNLINYSNAIRSEGIGGNSLQAGSNALASGSLSTAIGNSATAAGLRSVALGNGALATNVDTVAIGTAARATTNSAVAIGNAAVASADGALALGNQALASGFYSFAIGDPDAIASGPYSVVYGPGAVATKHSGLALGYQAFSDHSNSVAFGAGATTTTTNQFRLGTSSEAVSIPGNLSIAGVLSPEGSITNHITTGTNRFNARLDLTARANTGLANGYNSGVVLGSNVYIRLSGPSGAYTNAGFAAAVDGTYHVLEFDNPVSNLTILDNSGLEATVANRITTGTGGLLNYTNNPVFLHVIYNATAARWRIVTDRR